MLHTIKLNTEQARAVHEQLSSHMAAQKNWIASAVETGDLPRAQVLVKELRFIQDIACKFNTAEIRDAK